MLDENYGMNRDFEPWLIPFCSLFFFFLSRNFLLFFPVRYATNLATAQFNWELFGLVIQPLCYDFHTYKLYDKCCYLPSV